MFPPNQKKEISFQISSTPNQETAIQQDPITSQNAADGTFYPIQNSNISLTSAVHGHKKSIDEHSKRIMHRDIERQRRKEMAALCTSLRNLLPFEYIKGKRSVSDQIHETVKYIKDQENKIEKLGLYRDEIKKLSNLGSDYANLITSTPTYVTVRSSFTGIEVVIDNGFGGQVFHLSRALQLLIEEGLNVVSCISNKLNQRIIHIIQSEVSYMTCTDISELQTKLNEAISLSSTENFNWIC